MVGLPFPFWFLSSTQNPNSQHPKNTHKSLSFSPLQLYASTWQSQPFVATSFEQQPHCKLPKQNQKPQENQNS